MPEFNQFELSLLVGVILIWMVAIYFAINRKNKNNQKNVQNNIQQDKLSPAKTSAEFHADAEDKTALVPSINIGERTQILAEPTEQDLVQPSAMTIKEALKNTESSFFGRIRDLFKAENSEVLEGIEEVLYTSDLGPQTVQKLMTQLNEDLSKNEKKDLQVVKSALKTKMLEIFEGSQSCKKTKMFFLKDFIKQQQAQLS